jgi:hypothetical protein
MAEDHSNTVYLLLRENAQQSIPPKWHQTAFVRDDFEVQEKEPKQSNNSKTPVV